MTKMPERIALSHAFGGLAAALVGVSEYYHHGARARSTASPWAPSGFEVFLGFLTFTGSLMAFGKLQGSSPARRSPTRARTPPTSACSSRPLALLVLVVLDPSRSVALLR